MIHPHTELKFIDDEIGYGVFATRFIPRGTVVWARDPLDRAVTPSDLHALPSAGREVVEKYTFRDATGDLILCWDLARFVNHSCHPTNLLTGEAFSISVRDTPAGAELTEDYASYQMVTEESFDCRCGSPGCRRRITPKDAGELGQLWEEAITAAVAVADSVWQPLLALLPAQHLRRARHARRVTAR
jgi:hypothetical protein